MRFWPSNIKILNIDYNRLICFNKNISSDHINTFINEIANFISKLNFLKDFSLNLCGIGYEGGTKSKSFPSLLELVNELSNIHYLNLDVCNHNFCSSIINA